MPIDKFELETIMGFMSSCTIVPTIAAANERQHLERVKGRGYYTL